MIRNQKFQGRKGNKPILILKFSTRIGGLVLPWILIPQISE
jgi:hypothetical protein